MPILDAANSSEFALMEAVRLRSPLLDAEHMKVAPNQLALLQQVGGACQTLCGLFSDNDPTLAEIVGVLAETGLLEIPDRLRAALVLGVTDEEPLRPSTVKHLRCMPTGCCWGDIILKWPHSQGMPKACPLSIPTKG